MAHSRHAAADAPHAHHAQRAASHLPSLNGITPIELARPGVAIRECDAFREVQHHTQRVLSHSLHRGLRRIHHLDAQFRGGLDVDVVHADTMPPHHLEPRRVLHDAPRHDAPATHYHTVDVLDLCDNRFLAHVAGQAHLARRAENLHPGFVDRFIEQKVMCHLIVPLVGGPAFDRYSILPMSRRMLISRCRSSPWSELIGARAGPAGNPISSMASLITTGKVPSEKARRSGESLIW